MADRDGDPAKKPAECKTSEHPCRCPHLVERSLNDMEREVYDCQVCGEHFTLYYDDVA